MKTGRHWSSLILLLALLSLLAGCGNREDGLTARSVEATSWTCSMHPQIQLPEAGDCPICGMDLIPMKQDHAGQDASATASAPTIESHDGRSMSTAEPGEPVGYACAMNCVPPLPEAGDCPVCGMMMVAVDAGGQEVDGTPILTLSPSAMARADIQTSTVRRRFIERSLQVQGEAALDEGSISHVVAWTGGRITAIHGARIGETVRRGDPLYELYSPDLIAAQRELLLDPGHPGPRGRLRQWGIADRELDQVIERGKARETLLIRSGSTGTVMRRFVEPGHMVTPGAMIVELANLETVWAQLSIDEADLPLVSPGLEATLHPEGLPGQRITGEITFVDPVVEASGRRARARVPIDNREAGLRPGQFLRASLDLPIRVDGKAPLSIPESAVLFTGERSLVYVESAPGQFKPREVQLGAGNGEWRAILHGLEAGESVVTQGAFRIDSALQIRGQASLMQPASGRNSMGQAHVH